MPRFLGLVVGALAVMLFALQGGQAFAAHVTCGDVITQDTTLDSDLVDCTGDGHRDRGRRSHARPWRARRWTATGIRPRPAFESGIANVREGPFVRTGRTRDVTIRGGTIREFGAGIRDGAGVVAALVEKTALVANGVGISLNDVYDTTVARSVLSANDDRDLGMDLERYRLERQRRRDNDGAGLDLVSATGGVVGRNRVEDNGVYGIDLQDGVSDNRGREKPRHGQRGCRNRGIRGHPPESHRGELGAPERTRAAALAPSEQRRSSSTGERDPKQRCLATRRSESCCSANERNNLVSEPSCSPAVMASCSTRTARRTWSRRNLLSGESAAMASIFASGRSWHTWCDGTMAGGNTDDGIDVASPGSTTFAHNMAVRNGDLGIEAVPGVSDGGGNVAFGNRNPLQCLNIRCDVPGRFK